MVAEGLVFHQKKEVSLVLKCVSTNGGPDPNRTGDLLIANQPFYLLNYEPMYHICSIKSRKGQYIALYGLN